MNLTHSGNFQFEIHKRKVEDNSTNQKEECVEKLYLRRIDNRCDDDKDGYQAGNNRKDDRTLKIMTSCRLLVFTYLNPIAFMSPNIQILHYTMRI